MRRVIIGLGLVLAVSACGSQGSEPSEPKTEIAPDAPIPVEPDGGIGDGAGPPAGGLGPIPARFQGVWDYEGGTCAPESDMRMEISGNEILFYESVGIVTAVEAEGETAVLSLDMEGEGESWRQRLRLSLIGVGDSVRLHTSDGDKPERVDEYPSKRCPS